MWGASARKKRATFARRAVFFAGAAVVVPPGQFTLPFGAHDVALVQTRMAA